MNPFDPNVHGDEFRLRLLVTDDCNKACPWCLNDFQPKPELGLSQYLDVDFAKRYINAYAGRMFPQLKSPGELLPTINISGGEPGMHPELLDIVKYAAGTGCMVVLNTNGFVFKHKDWLKIKEYVGDLRIHVFPREFINFRRIYGGKISFQAVYADASAEAERWYTELIEFYGRVKFFVDFNADKGTRQGYTDFILRMQEKYGADRVFGRFTGRQENRGPLCDGCTKECVTLKALWVFPGGSCSPCPQGVHPRKSISRFRREQMYINEAYDMHKRRNNG